MTYIPKNQTDLISDPDGYNQIDTPPIYITSTTEITDQNSTNFRKVLVTVNNANYDVEFDMYIFGTTPEQDTSISVTKFTIKVIFNCYVNYPYIDTGGDYESQPDRYADPPVNYTVTGKTKTM